MGWDYQNNRVIIVPYVGGRTSENFAEDFTARLYLQTKHDGLLRRTFPGNQELSFSWFVNYFHNRTMLIGMIKPAEIAGYAWVYDTDGHKASVGVCFFRKYFGQPEIQELSRLGLAWFFRELNLGVIFGTIAETNRLSLRFAKLLGFKVCGVLPKFFLQGEVQIGNIVGVLLREEFSGWSDPIGKEHPESANAAGHRNIATAAS